VIVLDIDTHIARVKDLIAKREEIDAELSTIFGVDAESPETATMLDLQRGGSQRPDVSEAAGAITDGAGPWASPYHIHRIV